ncbi:ABC transporter ATP-binding protein [Pseudobutyrivibrio xylanivorans]|uniref:ABC transporter ATP-binding protein n=1 Tax=Pseudobutyrivibrio xylanivorans TaxID=185007 RepID=A0A5P6VR40_PSEXY|nr:ABC transporter ATP-binding protein [Pseudobutyrivibrio xylanivorans]QFJ55143.1 ABC transporter ATP-binding protein [Pseudobutyrivibrio xylanivorans]
MKEKKKSVLPQLFVYAGKHKYLTIASWILAGISALLALAPFYFIWCIIREVIEVRPDFSQATHIKTYGWWAVGMAVLSFLIYIAALMCSHLAAFRVQVNMRVALMEHIMKLPMGYIESEGSGKIRKIVADSTAATETYLAHSLPDKAVSYVTPVGLLGMLLFFDWKIGLICLIPAVLAFLSMGFMMGPKMVKAMSEYQDALDEMSAEAVEYVRGIPVVKTFGQSVFSFKRFKEAIDKYENWTVSYTTSVRIPMTAFVTLANAVFAALVACAFIFARDSITNPFLFNILFYIIITPILTVTLLKVAYSGESEMIVRDALQRMYSILNVEPLSEAANPKKPADSSIELKDVTFSYSEDKRNAIEGINLSIKPGQHIALVGPSGGGKTTLASLVARFWDVKNGSIKIGGVDVKDIATSELMNQVSYVFQDSKLLKMSILDNVRMGNPDATEAEVMQALKDAQCMDIIEKFPEGIHTMIGSEGVYVSGGEAQRLSIARAFLKNSPILILDEATAFADTDNEAKVQQAFANLSKDKTVIMIAHRLSTVVDADRILVLSDGKVIEEGKHEDLIKQSGTYSHMWSEYNKSINWKVGKSA